MYRLYPMLLGVVGVSLTLVACDRPSDPSAPSNSSTRERSKPKPGPEPEPKLSQGSESTGAEETFKFCGQCSIPARDCLACSTPTLSSELQAKPECVTQQAVNCFAWNNFIALNWPVEFESKDPLGQELLGRPGVPESFQLVRWQTFREASEVFGSEGSTVESDCEQQALNVNFIQLPEPLTNAKQPDGNWLADVNGNVVWYEVRINDVEYQYIKQNGLDHAAGQWKATEPGVGKGIILPDGSIEIKAGWREIPPDQPELYRRYLMTEACVPKPGGGQRKVALGLAALHIIQKSGNGGQQWVWTTFEQVDNVPIPRGQKTKENYAFYNSDCKTRKIPRKCVGGGSPAEYACDGSPPPYSLHEYFKTGSTECGPIPIQVTRRTPIPRCPPGKLNEGNPVVELNSTMQHLIREQLGDSSVLQYYELINTMWSTQELPPLPVGVAIPLRTSNMEPTTEVANTVLETYAQNTNCAGCHADASIAKLAKPKSVSEKLCSRARAGTAPCATDYSFIFDDAQ